MKIKLWLMPILLLLSACQDEDRINQVKSLVQDNDTSVTLGNALDHREVCEQSRWSQFDDEKGRPVVEYRCVFPESKYLPAFQSLRVNYLNTLNDNLRQYNDRLNDALREQQAELQRLDKARSVFDALNKSGDLQRYQSISRHFDSAMAMSSARQLNEFFSDERGERFIADELKGDPDARGAINRIYSAFRQAGLEGEYGRNARNEFCSPPDLLLAPMSSPAEVRQSLDDCQAKMSQRGDSYSVRDSRSRIERIKASLGRVNVSVDAIAYQETFRWSVIPNKEPVLYYHAFTLSVKNHPDMDVTSPNDAGNSYTSALRDAYQGNNFSDYKDRLWRLVAVMYHITD